MSKKKPKNKTDLEAAALLEKNHSAVDFLLNEIQDHFTDSVRLTLVVREQGSSDPSESLIYSSDENLAMVAEAVKHHLNTKRVAPPTRTEYPTTRQ